MDKFQSLLVSRRFLGLLAGILVVFSEEFFSVKLNEDNVNQFLFLLSSWIVGDSLRKTQKE